MLGCSGTCVHVNINTAKAQFHKCVCIYSWTHVHTQSQDRNDVQRHCFIQLFQFSQVPLSPRFLRQSLFLFRFPPRVLRPCRPLLWHSPLNLFVRPSVFQPRLSIRFLLFLRAEATSCRFNHTPRHNPIWAAFCRLFGVISPFFNIK